jgi:hypothetical protein
MFDPRKPITLLTISVCPPHFVYVTKDTVIKMTPGQSLLSWATDDWMPTENENIDTSCPTVQRQNIKIHNTWRMLIHSIQESSSSKEDRFQLTYRL